MISKLLNEWETLYYENTPDVFLKEVLDYFYDNRTITDTVITLLQRFYELNTWRREKIIKDKEYVKRRENISFESKNILLIISEYYLPIVPVKAVAGVDSGPYNSIEVSNVDEWKQMRQKVIDKIGIRVTGDSMKPLYEDGVTLVCKKTTLDKVADNQSVIIVGRDNSVYLKKITKEKNNLNLISLNKEYKPFKMLLTDVLEIWQIEGLL